MLHNKIVDLIYDITTKEAGIYTSLFGFDGYETKKIINYSFCIPNDDDLYTGLKIFLDHVIATICIELNKTNEIIIDDPIYNSIWYDGVEYINSFIDKSMDLDKYLILCDFENLLNNFRITNMGSFISINFELPIYDLDI